MDFEELRELEAAWEALYLVIASWRSDALVEMTVSGCSSSSIESVPEGEDTMI